VAKLDVIVAQLACDGPDAVQWRRQQLARMGDVSQYMKILKQRFSTWYNNSHDRFGPLWADRFKSVLVAGEANALQTMAAYIELNAVRAGLADDPKDFHFCGYAEAVAGNTLAQAGIGLVTGASDWSEVQARYREMIFGAGAGPREDAATISVADCERVMAEGGKLPLAAVLRCRLRHLTDGAVFGSKAFVEAHLARYRQKVGRCERTRPRSVPALEDWGELMTLRQLRRRAERREASASP
jgi:putative transposase